jgi:predicted nucleic acid-binding protein
VSAIVVDTSVWIDFFGGRPAERLDEALQVGSIVIPPVVVSELLSGAKGRDRGPLLEFLSDMEVAATPFTHWVAVGDLRAALLRRGLTVSTPDAHVAQCALDRDALLMTHDAVFTRMAAFVPLRVTRA